MTNVAPKCCRECWDEWAAFDESNSIWQNGRLENRIVALYHEGFTAAQIGEIVNLTLGSTEMVIEAMA